MKILSLAIFLFFSLFSFSQTSVYNQTWISGAYQKNFDVKKKENALNIRIDASYRSIEWFKFNRQFVIREISTWNFNDRWHLGIGPCFSWQYPYYEVKPVFEFRPTTQLIYTKINREKSKYENNFFEWSVRFRWEFRYFKFGEKFDAVYHRPRLLGRIKFPVNAKNSLVVQEEFMFQKNPNTSYYFQTNRIYIGFIRHLNKINLEAGFMFQYIDRLNDNYELDNNSLFGVWN